MELALSLSLSRVGGTTELGVSDSVKIWKLGLYKIIFVIPADLSLSPESSLCFGILSVLIDYPLIAAISSYSSFCENFLLFCSV